jgi:flagellar capping protein FliD
VWQFAERSKLPEEALFVLASLLVWTGEVRLMYPINHLAAMTTTTDTDLRELKDLIAANHNTVTQQTAALSQQITATNQQIAALSQRVEVGFAQVDIKFAQVDTKLAQVDTKISDLRGEINTV